MRKLKVLVGCEFSGVVRRAFRALGHDAWSCDLLPSEDGSEHHLQCDVLTVLDDGWDVGIFHPDCTYLCASGMHWTTRGLRDPQLTVDAIKFAEKLWDAKIPSVCIENPRGCLSTKSKLGKPTCSVQPYQFSHDASKETFLWCRNLPKLKPTKFIPPRMVCKCGTTYPYEAGFKYGCPKCGAGNAKPRWSNQTDSGQNKLGPSDDRWKKRARTYEGIANAMAAQYSDYLTK